MTGTAHRRPTPSVRSPVRSSARPGVDAEALARLLDGEYADTRAAMRALLSRPEFALRHGLPTDEYRELVFKWTKQVADHGFGALSFPVEYGGGGDIGRFFAAFDTLATHDQSLTIKFGVQFGLFGGSILFLGTERHYAKYLRDVGRLKIPGCFAMSELGHGSNVRDILTEARYDPASREFVIDTPSDAAHKEWIGNAAAHGTMATVFAQLYVGEECHGVHALLVPIRDAEGRVLPGVRIEDTGVKMGLNGVDNGRLWFHRVRVPRENLLNRYGDVAADGTYSSPISSPGRRFFTMLSTLVGGRITIAGVAQGAAKVGLATAVRYSALRRQFGAGDDGETPILDYLTHQRRLFPAVATTYAVDFALKALTRRFLLHRQKDERETEALAAGLKAYASWQAIDALQQARECCGGQGYLPMNRIAQMRVDADITVTFEGDNTVLMQLVARSLLTDFKMQFGAETIGRALRYLQARAAQTFAGLSPVTARKTDEAHLRDPAWQLLTFKYRETRLVCSAARRIKAMGEDGIDTAVAFLKIQDHLLAAANAHVERVVFESFREAIDNVADAPLRASLDRLAHLYALSRFERHEGWYLEKKMFDGGKARAVRTQVNKLCGEIRPHAVDYVNGFGIPDAILAAPIAFSALPTARDG